MREESAHIQNTLKTNKRQLICDIPIAWEQHRVQSKLLGYYENID